MRLLLDGPDITSVLTKVHAEHGPDARIVSAERVRVGGLAGFFARERFEVAVEVGPPDPGTPSEPSEPSDEPAGSILDLAAAVDRLEREEGQLAVKPPVVAKTAGPSPGFAELLAVMGGPDGISRASAHPARPAATAPPVAPAPRDLTARSHERTDLCDRLRGLGVPEHLLASVGAGAAGDAVAVVTRLARLLPAPPTMPTGSGQVVVLVGDGVSAFEEAQRLARRARLAPSAVHLASPTPLGTGVPASRLVSSPAVAAERRARLARSATAAIVAVEAPFGEAGATWAARVVAALQPATTWYVAEASRKVADTADQICRIGGADGLVVTGTDATRDPATVLALRLPIAWLDGRRATAEAWTALLCGRLAEGDQTRC